MMRQVAGAVAVVLCAVLLGAPAHALIPPLTEQELEEQAHLIVEGRVAFIAKDGKVRFDDCYGRQHYRAEVAVDKVLKGKWTPGNIVVLRYSTIIVDKGMCDGGEASYVMAEAKRYKLYLQPINPKSEKAEFEFFHYQCLEKLPSSLPKPKPKPNEAGK